ncbi:hypothetical protein BAE44_0006734 [Dichanthelium oligosanthes]|uniref:PLAT domain-containing protein n=1 Tax=Dichanthelium oligosanthes TaxID=888268 RepID=A0A1E5W4S2_9POAL|nr:hypothetical protein BAE44_0006734 [Dichanthelium oligosanthes]
MITLAHQTLQLTPWLSKLGSGSSVQYGGEALSFPVLLSFVILAAAGSRSPAANVQPIVAPLQSSTATAGSNDNDYGCVYTIYVETGSIWKAGTDSVIGLGLRSADGAGFTVTDLARWGGLMGAGHDYYERGNVDIFSGRAPCLASPPCAMNLTSNGSGPHHGWYCRSVEVTAAAPRAPCARAAFGVEQWLARDAPPYQLYAERSACARSGAEEPAGRRPLLTRVPHLSGSIDAAATNSALPPATMRLLPPCLLLVVVFFAAAAAHAAAADAVTDVGGGAALSDPENECVYTVYVRTGSIWKGGTDSTIGVALWASDGHGIRIEGLAAWGGLMGQGHDYYERGNLDIFSGRGPCLSSASCAMNLTSDGAGAHHGWYCNYLEVTYTGPHLGCAQRLFTVEQWLATDAPPYRLYAAVDKCGEKGKRAEASGGAAL